MYETHTQSTSENARLAPSSGDTAAYETHTQSTRSEHAPRGPSSGDAVARGTDPKFARESFTMRKMLPWQIAALAIAAALVLGLALFYF